MSLPTITISPIADALRAIYDYWRSHQGEKPTHLGCGHDAYANLLAVGGLRYLVPAEAGGYTLDGVLLVEDGTITGYVARTPRVPSPFGPF